MRTKMFLMFSLLLAAPFAFADMEYHGFTIDEALPVASEAIADLPFPEHAAVAMIVRYRGSTDVVQRAQLKWLALGAAAVEANGHGGFPGGALLFEGPLLNGAAAKGRQPSTSSPPSGDDSLRRVG